MVEEPVICRLSLQKGASSVETLYRFTVWGDVHISKREISPTLVERNVAWKAAGSSVSTSS